MNYLLYGEEEFLINQQIDKIIKKEQLDAMSIIRYDLELDSIKNIIDDCQTISLFEDKKVIIVNNCNYFNRIKNSEEDINLLLQYFNNCNPNTILILVSHNSSIDSTKKITKKIKEIGKILEFNGADTNSIVKKMFDNYKIKDNTINLLITRVGNNIEILAQEVLKLKTYKYDGLEITNDDVIACSTYNVDTDIFKFIDNIINKNKDIALKTYYELLKNNEEPIKIIALLASKFRLMYQVKTLGSKNMNNNEIALLLGVHAYPVKLAREASIRYSDKLLLKFLKALALLDSDIKTGKVNPELGLELFIVNV